MNLRRGIAAAWNARSPDNALPPASGPTPATGRSRVLAWLLTWLTVLATVAGYFHHSPYDPVQAARIKTLLLLALAMNVLAAAAHALNRRLSLPMAVAGTWAIAALYHAGLAASIATALLALAAIGVGSLFARGADDHDAPQHVALVGLGLLTAMAGWLLAFPVHHRLGYTLVALLLVVARARAIGSTLRTAASAANAAIGELPWVALAAINVVGVCSTPLWLPTMQADDLSYHLAMPFQLQELGYYRLDVSGSLWAVAPWAADLVQAMGQVLAGTEARGAVNLGWMLALYAGMWRLCRIVGLPPLLSWAAISLHASLPLTSSLLAGMQTELPSAAVVVALAVAIGEGEGFDRRRLPVVAILSGLLLAMKLSNALLLAPLGLWLAVRSRSAPPWRELPRSIALGALVALPSYVYAWLVAGNPVLPFLNGIFKSRHFLQENWTDPAWMHPVSALLPWQLMFETSNYQTAVDGGAGFAYLFCAGGLVAALFHPRVRALALVGLAGFALVFMQVHFIRYTHPVIALLIIAAIGGLAATGLHRSVAAAVALLCALNLGMAGAGFWQIRDGALETLLKDGPAETLRRYAPQRSIAGLIREQADAGTRVLFHMVDANGNAELTVPAYTTSWYNWDLVFAAGAADADPSGDLWRKLLARRGINLLVVHRGHVTEGLRQALVGTRRDPRLSIGEFETWRFDVPAATPVRLLPLESGGAHAAYAYSLAEPGSRITTTAKFSCDVPDEPIVISIGVERASVPGQQNLISGWAMCKADGTAEGTIEAITPDDTRSLVFIAWPRSPMDFRLLDSRSESIPGPPPLAPDPASVLRGRIADLVR